MDLRNMRQLLAIRSHGSFAKAARALGMSQPSLSTAIARLEDQLKVKLFERSSTGSELTPIGELIAERAAKVVAETDGILREAELVAGGDSGTVRVGIGTALRQNFLAEFVTRIAREHPGLHARIHVADRDRLVQMLKAHELDLVVCAPGEELSVDGLVVTAVLTCQTACVAHPTHPLAGETRISPRRLAQFAIAGADLIEYSNAVVLGMEDAPGGLSHYAANDYDALIPLALNGVCALFAPAYVVQPYVEAQRLVVLDVDRDIAVTFAAITTRAATYSPIVNRLVGYAVELGARLEANARRSRL